MTAASWLQLAALIGLIALGTRVLGAYLAAVFGGGSAPGDGLFGRLGATDLPGLRDRPEP